MAQGGFCRVHTPGTRLGGSFSAGIKGAAALCPRNRVGVTSMRIGKVTVPPIGMRTVKTTLSVMLCLALGTLLSRETPLFSCIAAVLTVRETVDNSISYGFTRVWATLLGGGIAFLLLYIDIMALSPWIQIPLIGLGVMSTLYLTVFVRRTDTTPLAVSTFLIIVLTHAGDRYAYAARRIVETVVGIVVAVLVNKYFNIPPFLTKLLRRKGAEPKPDAPAPPDPDASAGQ